MSAVANEWHRWFSLAVTNVGEGEHVFFRFLLTRNHGVTLCVDNTLCFVCPDNKGVVAATPFENVQKAGGTLCRAAYGVTDVLPRVHGVGNVVLRDTTHSITLRVRKALAQSVWADPATWAISVCVALEQGAHIHAGDQHHGIVFLVDDEYRVYTIKSDIVKRYTLWEFLAHGQVAKLNYVDNVALRSGDQETVIGLCEWAINEREKWSFIRYNSEDFCKALRVGSVRASAPLYFNSAPLKRNVEDVAAELQQKLTELHSRMSSLAGNARLNEFVAETLREISSNEILVLNGFPTKTVSSSNLCFVGPPATGKTTAAFLLARVLHWAGRLPLDKLTCVSGSDLIGEYVGQTGPKTRAVVEEAAGGLLLIDDVSGIVLQDDSAGLAKVCLSELVQQISKHQHNTVLILVGNERDIKKLLTIEPAIDSRFQHFRFESLSVGELADIVEINDAAAFVPGQRASSSESLSALHVAAAAGDVEASERLLSDVACNIDGVTADGMTALHTAVHHGNGHVVNLLLDRGADLQLQTKSGATVFFLAAASGEVSILKELVAAKHKSFSNQIDATEQIQAHVRTATLDGQTPLFAAASNGHSDMIKRLCILGADVSVTSGTGLSPLQAAALGGHVAAVTTLLERGARRSSLNRELNTRNDIAFLDMLKRLSLCCSGDIYERDALANSLSSNIDEVSPLCLASNRGHVAVIETLLQHCSDPPQAHEIQHSLLAAVIGDHDVVIRALASGSVSNANWYDMPLLTASVLDHDTNIKTLFALGANPMGRCFSQQITPLHAAAAYGNVAAVQALVHAGTPLAYQDINGWTPLHAACRGNHASVVNELLRRDRFATDVKTNEGATPVQFAALFSDLDAFETVIGFSASKDNESAANGSSIRDVRNALTVVSFFANTTTAVKNLAKTMRIIVEVNATAKDALAMLGVRDTLVPTSSFASTSTVKNLEHAMHSIIESNTAAKNKARHVDTTLDAVECSSMSNEDTTCVSNRRMVHFAPQGARNAIVMAAAFAAPDTIKQLAIAIQFILVCTAPASEIMLAAEEARDALVTAAAFVTTPNAVQCLSTAISYILVNSAPAKLVFATEEVMDTLVTASAYASTPTAVQCLSMAIAGIISGNNDAKLLFATYEVRDALVLAATFATTPDAVEWLSAAISYILVNNAPAKLLFSTEEMMNALGTAAAFATTPDAAQWLSTAISCVHVNGALQSPLLR